MPEILCWNGGGALGWRDQSGTDGLYKLMTNGSVAGWRFNQDPGWYMTRDGGAVGWRHIEFISPMLLHTAYATRIAASSSATYRYWYGSAPGHKNRRIVGIFTTWREAVTNITTSFGTIRRSNFNANNPGAGYFVIDIDGAPQGSYVDIGIWTGSNPHTSSLNTLVGMVELSGGRGEYLGEIRYVSERTTFTLPSTGGVILRNINASLPPGTFVAPNPPDMVRVHEGMFGDDRLYFGRTNVYYNSTVETFFSCDGGYIVSLVLACL